MIGIAKSQVVAQPRPNLYLDSNAFFFPGMGFAMAGLASAAAALVGANNQVRGISFTLSREISIAKMALAIVTGIAGSAGQCAIYNFAGTSLLVAAPSFSTAASATAVTESVTPAVKLAAGTYNFCWTGTITTVTATSFSQLATIDGILNQAGIARVFTAANPSVSGNLPATLGALTAASFTAIPAVLYSSS